MASHEPLESAGAGLILRPRRSPPGNPYAIPILPYLLSSLAGCMAFGWVGPGVVGLSALCLLLAGAAFSAAFSAKVFWFWNEGSKFKIPQILICAGLFLGFFGYAAKTAVVNPYPHFTGIETHIQMYLKEVSTGKNDSRYGVGVITLPPKGFPKLEGALVWYMIGDGKRAKVENRNFVRSQIVSVSGVLQPVRTNARASEWASESENKSREFERYLGNRFIYYRINAQIANSEIVCQANGFYRFFADLNVYLQRSLETFVFPFQRASEAANTYVAMLLGEKSRLTKEQKDSFARTGTMHVFAISGLHVGFAAALLYLLAKLFRFPRILQPVAALPLLFAYVEACGGRPSAMRAFMMVAVFWLALSFGRGMTPWSALALSAFAAILISPLAPFDAGFSLSYGVVASIFVYGLPLSGRISKAFDARYQIPLDGSRPVFEIVRRICIWTGGAVAISLGAFFAGAPLCAYYFSYISPAAVLYSPLFVLFAGWVVFCGFGAFLVPQFAASILNSVAWFAVWAMSFFAQEGNAFFDASVDFPLGSGVVCVLSLSAFLGLSALSTRGEGWRGFVLPGAVSFAIMLSYRFAEGFF